MLQKQATNGSFSKPTGYFSQISNQILRDESLSLKSKGLYSLIFSYITLPNFTLYKNYLQNQCSEGRCAFDSAWKELVCAGYLVHTRSRQPDGTFSYNYSITSPKQEPDKTTDDNLEHTSHKEDGNNTSTPIEKNPLISAGSTKEKKDSLRFPVVIPPITENQTAVSYIYNKTIQKNTKSVSDLDVGLINDLKIQIDYDFFVEDSLLPKDQKLAVFIILEYLIELSSSADVFSKSLVNTVDSCVINEFLEHMAIKRGQKIKYPLPYWRKAFLNFLKESALSLVAI